MLVRKIVHTLCGVVLLGVLATSATGAMIDTVVPLTSRSAAAVQMPGVALPAGTYIFEVVNPDGGSDVVRVMSRDRKKMYLMQLTRSSTVRPRATSRRRSPSAKLLLATLRPVKAWYPQIETRGREFIY